MTRNAVREPQITRESTSYPAIVVPKGCAADALASGAAAPLGADWETYAAAALRRRRGAERTIRPGDRR